MISSGFAKILLKPRLGMRRAKGIWPPSKPTRTLPPLRAFWPLWPRPPVLPLPEPAPRPLRYASRTEPSAGDSSLSFIIRASLLHFSDLQQIADLGNLATGGIVVGLHSDITDFAQTQGICSGNLLFQAAVQALDELNI